LLDEGSAAVLVEMDGGFALKTSREEDGDEKGCGGEEEAFHGFRRLMEI
jgi:hypothetical protein